MNRPFVAANRSIDGLPRLRPRNPLQPRLLFNASRCYGLRQLHSSPAPRQQHLLWAGKLLDQTTSTFQPLSHSLILAAGAADDLDRGDITLLTPAASATRGHSLLPYRTAEPESLTRVLAIGRNTHAQLGLGFASQEATFGLVRPGFFGTGGISAILAGTSQSWMITTDQDSNQRFAFAWGDNTQGQLGLGRAVGAGAPQSDLHPLPRQIKVPTQKRGRHNEDAFDTVAVAIGLDHALMSTTCQKGSAREHAVYATGLNADGQAGVPVTTERDAMGLPMGTQLFDFQRVLTSQDIDLPHPTGQWNLAAGGDTSFAWIQAGDQVRVWAWGNNEYGQCLVSDAHAGDVGTGAAAALHSPDQLPFPVEVTQAIQQALGSGRRLADVKVGGSWLALLDDAGDVYTAGFGPLGRQVDDGMHAAPLKKVEGLPRIATISASLDAVLAVSSCRRRIFAWGLERCWGNLGSGQTEQESGTPTDDAVLRRIETPEELDVTSWMRPEASVQAAVCGGDHSWVLIEDNVEPRGVWRGIGNDS